MSLQPRLRAWLSQTPLREQLESVVSVIAIVIGVLGLSTLIFIEYRSARATLLSDLEVQTRIFAANSAAAAAFMDSATAHEVLAAMKSSPNIVSAQLSLTDGTELTAYHAPASEQQGLGIWSQRVEFMETVSHRGQTYGQLRVVGDLAGLNQRLFLYSVGALATLVVIILLLRLAFRRAVAVLMHPVSDLIRLMRIVSADRNYSLRSAVTSRNELGDIAKSFNVMLEQIEARDTALALELDERRSAQNRLAHLAHHDTLTGLANRHAFLQAVGSGQRLSLLLLDVDHFKLVNDSLGHNAGDQLLVEIANRLRLLNEQDTEVFRIGGDEFAILLRGRSNPEAAQQLADRIMLLMRAPIRVGGHELFTSFSTGIALCPEHAQTVDLLLNYADLALYSAKAQGRDRWALYSPDLKARTDERLRLESDLRRALDRDEFTLLYEPQVQLATGTVVGAEALVRWQHPQRGEIGPTVFIPIAEETGLILRLGEWVLRRACLEATAIQRMQGIHPFHIAVNLSPRQLADPGIVGMVARVLTETGFPAASLELEVTESVMIEKLDLISERMRAIAELGVRFAMDDFGVGASSLSYLRRLPLSKIKIDRSFVRELPQNDDDAAVAAAITALGHRLGIPVLAEGIESSSQLTCLQGMGCDLAQGYWFSKPKTLLEFIAYLASQATSAQLEDGQAPGPGQRSH